MEGAIQTTVTPAVAIVPAVATNAAELVAVLATVAAECLLLAVAVTVVGLLVVDFYGSAQSTPFFSSESPHVQLSSCSLAVNVVVCCWWW